MLAKTFELAAVINVAWATTGQLQWLPLYDLAVIGWLLALGFKRSLITTAIIYLVQA